MSRRVAFIMAGGTGGHVFPALATARVLRRRGFDIVWLGTQRGIEARLVPAEGIPVEWLSVGGLRGKGVVTLLAAPFRLVRAIVQAVDALRRHRPAVVLGAGGFASGPGGIAAWLLAASAGGARAERDRGPHQSGTRAAGGPGARGFSRQLRSTDPRRARRQSGAARDSRDRRTRTALPGARRSRTAARIWWQPGLGAPERGRPGRDRRAAGNAPSRRAAPDRAARVSTRPRAAYRSRGLDADVRAFIDDMAGAYGWADLAVCRSGALTVAELAAAGVPAILVPFPAAVDDHQTRNASYAVEAGAAVLMPEATLTPVSLAAKLRELLEAGRPRLLAMAQAARRTAITDADERLADACVAVAGGAA